jgi:aryl sulfotransferase
MTGIAGPACTRVYRNHHLDSRRWERVKFRPDDILISTSYKAGTTWTQRIVSLLLFGPGPLPAPLFALSPWIDARFFPVPLDTIVNGLEAQTHRRFMKSHLPLDGLPWDPDVKYVMVGRDGRDVFMSLVNHYGSYTDLAYQLFNSGQDFEGEPLPRCPDDLHELFEGWVHHGWFPWERDGWPFWSHLHHAQSFWAHRNQPNIHFVHYADLKADLEGEMRRLAQFLGVAVSESDWPLLAHKATFATMREEAIEAEDPTQPEFFSGGQARFFFKGTNGRWRDVLTTDELVEYDKAVARTLTPDCAAWLEHGRTAIDPKTD